ncbi:UPF0182 family protein [Corynebacterium lizhenjunii]|uniref:UPF0182 protein G7Y31_03190 n=1 Tax=Corynebacterium lizhenjunii TaxID=2709394 RepID=A0A7T0PCG8_9CORY|nr:UPF0182 family protein [Corynebacterium lizhenjunii]QPK79722.1 UPF0182 family protein [Corynebacterium lizhenjunii]
MATGYPQPAAPLKRPPRALSWAVTLIAVLLFLGPMAVGFYTDWKWFGAIDYRGVFTTVIVARIVIFLIGALLGGLITWAAAFFVWRGRPEELDMGALDSPIHAYRSAIERSVRSFLAFVPLLVGLATGFLMQVNWRAFLLFINSQEFGVQDAQFGQDLGFYAFQLPVFKLLVSTLSLLVMLAFLLALAGHYMLGGIRIGSRAAGVRGTVTPAARMQLAITGGLWMLLQVAGYWLERYELLYKQNSIFTGASYTDLNAYLPAKIILMVIGVVVAIAFFMAVVVKDLRIPGLAVVMMLVSSIVIGTAWPLLMEQFSVNPNRQAKEAESIARNIDATRYAYGLSDDKVTFVENWGAGGAKDADVAADVATISNLRLLDPDILGETFTQMQQLRNFYGFPDTLAMDRYEIDGETRDFVVAARELDPNALSENQRDWINRHTVYTHGNGFIAAEANKVDEVARDAGSTRGGYPVFTVSDLQTQAGKTEGEGETQDAEESLGIKVEQPRTYYGPVIASSTDGRDYAIVGKTGDRPVEYDTDQSTYTYDGEGGVSIGNYVDRAAYALKYREMNFLLSDRVGSESKILYDRDPRERVEQVAPWLTTDSKTYPAVIDGRIKWIVDGYTTLSALPYAQQALLRETTQDALNPDGTNQRLFNDRVGYIRNSVKATVDAYDGTVTLYEFDTQDPVLKAWQGVFPDVVKPRSEISEELHSHLRYPEDMFKVQRDMLARYHVDDPGVFFNNDAFWSVPEDPNAREGSQALNQPPYYVMAADPETGEPSFQLISTFRGLKREYLSAHMSVSSDPETYGQMTVRVLPTNTQTLGPKQAQDAMMSSDQVARDRSLWESTNLLQNGNLLALPVGGGEILYLEPIYSKRKGQESAFPKMLRVLVSYKGSIGYAPTISEALEQVGIDPKAAQDIEEVSGDGAKADSQSADAAASADSKDDAKPADAARDSRPASAPASTDAGQAISAINDALKGLEDARDGSHEEYGRALDALDKAVAEYQRLNN